MTLLDKVQELQNVKPPLSQDEFNSQLNAYKAAQPKEEVVEPEIEGKTSDSTKVNPNEESTNEVTDSNSEDGSSDLPASNFDFINGDLSEILEDKSGFKQGVQKRQKEAYEKYTAIAKPDETITQNGYDMKYDSNGNYYTKKEGSNNWTNLEPGTKAHISVASRFNHADYDLDKANKTQKILDEGNSLFDSKPKPVPVKSKTIEDIIAEDKTGAFAVDPSLVIDVKNKVSVLEKEMKDLGLSILDPKNKEIQDKINNLKASIDPIATAKFKSEKFSQETALTGDQKMKVKAKTIEFMSTGREIPETTTSNVVLGREGGKAIRGNVTEKTGKMIPNPKWTELEANAKISLAAQLDVDVDKLEDTPENQEKIDAIIRSTYEDELETTLSDTNIKNWIHSKRDLFTKGEAQEQQALYEKINLLDVQKNKAKTLETITDAQTNIQALRKSMRAISKADFQTQDEVDSANELFKKLKNQEQKLVSVYDKEYKKIDDILDDENEGMNAINFLERNYSFTANFLTSAQMATVDLAQGVEEVLFRVADAPNAFNFADSKIFTALSPFNKLASMMVGDEEYRAKRKEINSSIDAWQEGVNFGMAKPVSLSDISDGADTGMYLAQMIGSQMPNTAILMMTGGAGLYMMGASSAGSSFIEMQNEIDASKEEYKKWELKNPKPTKEEGETDEDYQKRLDTYAAEAPEVVEYSPIQMYGVATLNGTVEVLSERISLGIINRSQKAFNLDSTIKKGFVNQIKSIFTKQGGKALGVGIVDTAGESLSEGGVEFASNIFDRVILKKDNDLFEGVTDAMVSGLVMSAGVYKSPGLFKSVVGMVQSPDSNQKIKENYKKIQDLEVGLRPPNNLSKASKKIITDQVADLVRDSSNEINKGLNRFTTLPIEKVRELSAIESNIFSIRQQMEKINSDPGLVEGKDKVIQGLKNKITKAEIQKLKIIQENAEFETAEGKVSLKARALDAGSAVIADQLGVGIETFNTQEDVAGALVTLKEEGAKVDESLSTNYGTYVTLPNGDTQILINQQEALLDNVVTTSQHEVLHAVMAKTFKGNPKAAIAFGQSLKAELDGAGVTLTPALENRLKAYEVDLNKVENNPDSTTEQKQQAQAEYFEEVLNLTSEGLTDNDITINETVLQKLKKVISNFFGSTKQPVNISFDKGKDVLDFLVNYNKSVKSGKGLTDSQLKVAKEGAKGNLVDMGLETEVDLGTVKSSKATQAKNQKLVREAKRGDLKAVDALIKDNSGIILQKLGFNKDIGDVKSQDVLNVVRDQAIGKGLFKGRQKPLFDNYNPTMGEVSTYLGDIVGKRRAEIFKAAGLDATKFDTVSTDAPQAQQVADTTEQTEFDEVTNEETGRDKVYPSQMESISSNIKPESIASIKEGAKRDILLNASKGVDAIVASIKSEAKGVSKILGKDVGTFAKGWPKFVNDIVSDGLTKVIPAAALKRRFGKVLNIKKTGTTPTKRTNPDTGKVTTFNKPVYEIPKADNQALVDYFTGQEKRRTSLLEVLGQDLVVEQLQELKNDNDFMSKLDSLTDGKASDIMDSVDSKLDTRNLEDTSLDTVKASKKPLTKIDSEQGKQQLEDIGQSRDINKAAKAMGIEGSIGVTPSNLLEKQAGILDSIEKYGITEATFLSSNFANFGKRKVNDVYIKEPAKGSLYFGKTDPAFQTALEAARKNGKKSDKTQRVNVKKAGTKEGDSQSNTNINVLESVALELESAVQAGMPIELAALFITSGYQATTGLVKISAKFTGESINPKFAEEGKSNQTGGKEAFREEHSPPASVVGASIIWAIKNGQVKEIFPSIRSNYIQVKLSKADDVKIDRAKLDSTLPQGISILTPNAGIIRFAESGINLNTITDFKTGKSFADLMNVGVSNKASKKNPNIVYAQNSLIKEQVNDIDAKTAQARIKAYEPIAALELESGKVNVDNLGNKVNVEMTIADQLTMLGTYDKAARNARAIDAPKKGISVFDFDDTLARTKEKVIVNNADGSSTEISASKFAETANELEANGATFDFTNFEGVADGTKKGPLADLALKRQDKFGSKDIFVLTARPQASAQAIKTFLDGIGLNLPLNNITGLANGTPGAKGNWVAGKAAEGYNDFYFADDAYKNVEAVQEVLSQVDVDSEVQIAKASKKKVFNEVFNDIIENSTGIKSYKKYSPAKAETIGASKGKFDFLIPPSAEDFTGLLYKTLGKGKVGDAQMAFYKTNLLDPYNRAEIAVVNAKIQAANDFKALKSNLKTLPKSLSKLTGIGKFTFSQAARVAIWTRQGMTVPGLSKTDLKQLNDFVDNNAELNTFADELIKIQKGKPYPKPTKTWVGGTITSDITTEIDKVNRKEYMQEFQENADIIFSDQNLAKLEAAYGPKYVEALKDSLRRMKSGSNRPLGGSRVVNNVLDWLNNSVGAVMFLNTRSAILQTLSAVNFIQVSGPNNILAAGKAFANQKQYWSDFMTLMNSPYLVERRNGLKINVSESEIADAVAESKNKPKAALAYLLSKGFVMTRFADSFAIATGGSAFYRNTVDALVKSGMDQKSAEKQAFDEFRALAEESQQSSNPSRISQQQASAAGRVILAFANTPMQYARIIKKSSQDLLNGRGDWKTNVSKIAYYGAIQNVVFNSLQQALFALAFEDDEEEKESKKKDKTGRIVNGMVDSLLKGAGIGGQAVASLKNALMRIAEEADKKSPEFQKAVDDLLGFSPPLSAKIRKIKGGLKAFSWNRKEMKEKGFDLNNPAYLASAQIISGLTNLPVDRAIKKLNNIRAIFSDSSAKWQKVAMALGWSTWDVGLPFYGVDDKEIETPETILRDKVINLKKETTTKEQKQMLLDLGLTKAEIKKLKYEEERVKKIIALQNKKKK